MQWELLPHAGMRSGDIEVLIGADRGVTHAAMARGTAGWPSARYPTADHYYVDGASMFLRYDADDTLEEIRLIDGRVAIDGLELLDTTWTELEPALAARGYSLTYPSQYVDGQDCPELGINITTRREISGHGDGIECVAMLRPDVDA